MFEREPITAEDARHVLWYFRQAGGCPPGGFTSYLLDAWGKADTANQARLRMGFPSLGKAIDLARDMDFDALRELAK